MSQTQVIPGLRITVTLGMPGDKPVTACGSGSMDVSFRHGERPTADVQLVITKPQAVELAVYLATALGFELIHR